MKIVNGYVEEVLKLNAECPYCHEYQYDIELKAKQAFEGNVLEHVCEVCGKEFKIKIED